MRQLAKRSTLALAIAASTALVLAEFATAATGPRTRASSDQVRGKEFSFALSTKSIRRPGKLTFRFRNAGTVEHDFRIDGKQTPLIRPGKTATISVTFKKPGRYRYLCTVPGHAAAGMRGIFVVH